MTNTLQKQYTMKASAFIVPNVPRKLNDEYIIDSVKTKYRNILSLNSLEETRGMIELWAHNHVSDNIGDHGITLPIGHLSIHGAIVAPVEILEDKKEGDVITLRLPATFTAKGEQEETILTLELELKQRGYRYENFGSFEEVLKKIGG